MTAENAKLPARVKYPVIVLGYMSAGVFGLLVAFVAIRGREISHGRQLGFFSSFPRRLLDVGLPVLAFLVPLMVHVSGLWKAEMAADIVAFASGQVPALHVPVLRHADPRVALSLALGWIIVPWLAILAILPRDDEQSSSKLARAGLGRFMALSGALAALLILYFGLLLPVGGTAAPWFYSAFQGLFFACWLPVR